jgi:hypothetical protein
MKWKVDPEAPPRPTFHNCIRCKEQYKLTVPYEECVPVNRDFCDKCLAEMDYEDRHELLIEIEDLRVEITKAQ